MLIFYGNTQSGDWGSMNIDGELMWQWVHEEDSNNERTKPNVRVHNDVVYTNPHSEKANFPYPWATVNSVDEYRAMFRDLLANSPETEIIVSFSTHGFPYNYQDPVSGMQIQGQAIVLGDGQYYYDKDLSADINEALPNDKNLYLIIDTCFSGGMFNHFEIKGRLDKSVITFAASNAEIVGYGTS